MLGVPKVTLKFGHCLTNIIELGFCVFGDVMQFKGYDGGWCPKHNIALVYSHLYAYRPASNERELASGKIVKVHMIGDRIYMGVLWRCPVRYCHHKRKELGRTVIGVYGRDSKGRILRDRRHI